MKQINSLSVHILSIAVIVKSTVMQPWPAENIFNSTSIPNSLERTICTICNHLCILFFLFEVHLSCSWFCDISVSTMLTLDGTNPHLSIYSAEYRGVVVLRWGEKIITKDKVSVKILSKWSCIVLRKYLDIFVRTVLS